MSFIDKYYAIFNNSVGQHSVTINRAEFANLLGVFSKQEQQLNQLKEKNEKLEQTLAEIEPVLELYANSKIGEEQLDGTYKVIVECLSVPKGAYILYYDPKPAKQALQKIRKV